MNVKALTWVCITFLLPFSECKVVGFTHTFLAIFWFPISCPYWCHILSNGYFEVIVLCIKKHIIGCISSLVWRYSSLKPSNKNVSFWALYSFSIPYFCIITTCIFHVNIFTCNFPRLYLIFFFYKWHLVFNHFIQTYISFQCISIAAVFSECLKPGLTHLAEYDCISCGSLRRHTR